jgi:hypothetical protein
VRAPLIRIEAIPQCIVSNDKKLRVNHKILTYDLCLKSERKVSGVYGYPEGKKEEG